MTLTINVPKNKLNPTFRFGFLISPAMKVTPFQASLENIEPTQAAETAAIKAIPPTETQEPVSFISDFVAQASAQLAFQISALAPKANPKMISPKSDKILMMVKTVCMILLFFTPRLLMYVSKTMVTIDTIWAA